MNYKDFVLSFSPSAYCTYDSGNSNDSAGVLTSTLITTGINPIYGYTNKAMGARSKEIGSGGDGTYDYRRFNGSGGTRKRYVYAEAWIYVPNSVTPSWTTYIFNAGSTTNPFTNASAIYIDQTRKIKWSTTSGGSSTASNIQTSVATIPVDTWVHVAAKYDNGAKTIYINGLVDSTSTAPIYSLNGTYYEACFTNGATIFVDEWAIWEGTSSAILPTDSQVLQRATFPMTKTKWWDPVTSSFIKSADELYWDGTSWVSMQDKTYQYWNGISWVTL